MRPLIPLLTVSLLSGCYAHHLRFEGGDDDGGVATEAAPDAAPGPVTDASEFLDRFFALHCADAVRCEGRISVRSRGRDVYEACHPTGQRWSFPWGDRDATVAAVRSGRVRFDPDAAQRCLSALRDLPCVGGVSPDYFACNWALTGAVPDGETCSFDLECQIGSFCGGSECPARCTRGAGARPGEACDPTPCAYPARCTVDAETRCGPIAGGRPLGAWCVQTEECAPGTQCRASECVRVPTVGERCDNTDISVGAYSNDAQCRPDGVCHARAAEGADCRASLCRPGDYCDGRVCEPAPGPGDECVVGPVSWCPWSFFCDAAPGESHGRCAPEREPGEPCASDDACTSARCEGGACAAHAAGDACNISAPTPCASGCEHDRCLPTPGEGEPCSPSAPVPCADDLACRQLEENDWRCAASCE